MVDRAASGGSDQRGPGGSSRDGCRARRLSHRRRVGWRHSRRGAAPARPGRARGGKRRPRDCRQRHRLPPRGRRAVGGRPGGSRHPSRSAGVFVAARRQAVLDGGAVVLHRGGPVRRRERVGAPGLPRRPVDGIRRPHPRQGPRLRRARGARAEPAPRGHRQAGDPPGVTGRVRPAGRCRAARHGRGDGRRNRLGPHQQPQPGPAGSVVDGGGAHRLPGAASPHRERLGHPVALGLAVGHGRRRRHPALRRRGRAAAPPR